MGACLLSGQQRMVDVSSHHKGSIVPFSSTNIMYMSMVVLWITASFCLFSLQQSIRAFAHQGGKGEPSMVADSFVVVCILWNLGLIVISAVGVYDERIPVNNTLISVIAAVLSIGIHAKNVEWGDMFKEDLSEDESTQAVDEKARMHAGYSQVYTGGRFDDLKSNISKIHKGAFADEQLRFYEYAITTPVFIAALVAAMSPSSTTLIISMVYVSTLGFIMACYGVTKFVDLATQSGVAREFSTLLVPFLLLGVLYPGVMTITLMQYDRSFTTGPSTQAIFYLLAITHGLMMLAFVVLTCVKTWWYSAAIPTTAHREENSIFDATVPIIYSCINLVQKLGVVSTVIFVYTSSDFPQQTCTLWAHL
jgi:hypothetical protein